jgi:hypothetical protein
LQFGIFAALTFLATGCGGLQGTYRVTPLSFLVPGLVRADCKPANQNTEPKLNEPFHESGRDDFHVVPSFGLEKWDDVEVVPTRFIRAMRIENATAKELAQTENSQISF